MKAKKAAEDEGQLPSGTQESTSYNKAHARTKNAPLAQLVEQLTLNQWVPGSSP